MYMLLVSCQAARTVQERSVLLLCSFADARCLCSTRRQHTLYLVAGPHPACHVQEKRCDSNIGMRIALLRSRLLLGLPGLLACPASPLVAARSSPTSDCPAGPLPAQQRAILEIAATRLKAACQAQQQQQGTLCLRCPRRSTVISSLLLCCVGSHASSGPSGIPPGGNGHPRSYIQNIKVWSMELHSVGGQTCFGACLDLLWGSSYSGRPAVAVAGLKRHSAGQLPAQTFCAQPSAPSLARWPCACDGRL